MAAVWLAVALKVWLVREASFRCLGSFVEEAECAVAAGSGEVVYGRAQQPWQAGGLVLGEVEGYCREAVVGCSPLLPQLRLVVVVVVTCHSHEAVWERHRDWPKLISIVCPSGWMDFLSLSRRDSQRQLLLQQPLGQFLPCERPFF